MGTEGDRYHGHNISCLRAPDYIPPQIYSHSGQLFHMYPPNTDQFGSDYLNVPGVYTLDTCLDLCSSQVGCTAFTWCSPAHDCGCWLKSNGSSATPSYLTGCYSGFTPIEAWTPVDEDVICPYPNLSLQNASNGASFKVICGTDFPGNDFLPNFTSSDPNYVANMPGPGWHADTYEECLELCATSHPLCSVFEYMPSSNFAWANCRFKTSGAQIPGGYSNRLFFGGVLQTEDFPSKQRCIHDSVQRIPNQQGQRVDFRLSCNDRRFSEDAAADIVALRHEDSVEDCLKACANADKCIAMMFDHGLEWGFDNCYLRSAFGHGSLYRNYTFAYLPTHADQYTPPLDEGGMADSNTFGGGQIAGSTVGGVFAIVLAVVLAWYYRSKLRKWRFKRPRALQFRGRRSSLPRHVSSSSDSGDAIPLPILNSSGDGDPSNGQVAQSSAVLQSLSVDERSANSLIRRIEPGVLDSSTSLLHVEGR